MQSRESFRQLSGFSYPHIFVLTLTAFLSDCQHCLRILTRIKFIYWRWMPHQLPISRACDQGQLGHQAQLQNAPSHAVKRDSSRRFNRQAAFYGDSHYIFPSRSVPWSELLYFTVLLLSWDYLYIFRDVPRLVYHIFQKSAQRWVIYTSLLQLLRLS